MRAMFGLVALLVGVAVLFYVFTKNTADTLRVAKPMQEQAQQMSGRGQDGAPAGSSFKVEPQQRGSQLDALLVTDVVPGGAADTFYGMKKGDRIIQISSGGSLMKINDASNGDPGMAKDMLIQGSFEASQPIVVMRDGKQLTLPETRTASPETSTQHQPEAQSLAVGSDFSLNPTANAITPVAITEGDLDRLLQLVAAHDDLGVRDLVSRGRVMQIASGTKCKVIDLGAIHTEIRVLEGPHQGASGWIPTELAHNRGTQSPAPTTPTPPQQPHNIWEQANQIKDAAGK